MQTKQNSDSNFQPNIDPDSNTNIRIPNINLASSNMDVLRSDVTTMAPTTRRARRAAAELPTDVLFDVFLPFSAKELCRLRVVCRAWRSITCDPHFIRAHAARHQRDDPLLVASFLSGPPEWRTTRIDLIDVSGRTVKRLASAMDFGQVLCPRLGLVFVAASKSDNTDFSKKKSDNTCRVLDPAAADPGALVSRRSRLPVRLAPSHRGPGSQLCVRGAATSFAFGRVAATGEHKLLRIFHRFKYNHRLHLFEVLTLGGGRRRHARSGWRDMPSPDMFVCPDSSVVVDGVVYFLRNTAVYNNDTAALPSVGIVPPADCIASFDLEREQWRRRLQGPISMGMGMGMGYDEDDEPEVDFNHHYCKFALAELKGSLVLVHYWYSTHLWILTDFDRGVWVKEYSIGINSINPPYLLRLKPLFVLDDGRLLARPRAGGDLAVYDPRTNFWTWFQTGRYLGEVGIYAGNLLGLQDAW